MYGLSSKKGQVVKIIEEKTDYSLVEVNISEEGRFKAFNYVNLTGKAKQGDFVFLNTTALDLGLGTGGYHFIISNLNNKNRNKSTLDKGHIMKLRYTPLQMQTLSVEEKQSPNQQVIKDFISLEGRKVIIIPLHSLLAPLTIVFKTFYPKQRLVYIMTDGACLPLAFSYQVRELVEKGYLDQTITIGHSFGGGLEAINIFTGLIAAKEVAKADLIVVGMGPGMVGTGTKYGFSGVENALINYAVQVLKGHSIIIPRISLADKRKRHYGISHHTITLLNDLILQPTDVVFPANDFLIAELKSLGKKHNLFIYPSLEVEEILSKSEINFESMGRKLKDDPLFFATAGLGVLHLQTLDKNI